MGAKERKAMLKDLAVLVKQANDKTDELEATIGDINDLMIGIGDDADESADFLAERFENRADVLREKFAILSELDETPAFEVDNIRDWLNSISEGISMIGLQTSGGPNGGN